MSKNIGLGLAAWAFLLLPAGLAQSNVQPVIDGAVSPQSIPREVAFRAIVQGWCTFTAKAISPAQKRAELQNKLLYIGVVDKDSNGQGITIEDLNVLTAEVREIWKRMLARPAITEIPKDQASDPLNIETGRELGELQTKLSTLGWLALLNYIDHEKARMKLAPFDNPVHVHH